MAIIDLPTTRGFQAATFSLGLDVSESTFTGALTGNRQRRSNLADRLRGTLLLPPTRDRAAAGQREALLMGMRSAGDYLRMGVPHRLAPLGTVRGAVTVAANVAAGARSLTVAGALSGVNLLPGGGFEIDTNFDSLADGLFASNQGTASGVTLTLQSGFNSPRAQNIAATGLGPSNFDRAGFGFPSLVATPGQVYTLSADVLGDSNGLKAFCYLQDGLTSSVAEIVLPITGWVRFSVTHTVAAGASNVQPYLWLGHNIAGVPVSGRFDNVQLQAGAVSTPYDGLPTLQAGDFIAVAGNLLQVAYGGATLNDAGAGTVPLTLPVQRAITAGAVVNVSAPTGLWELDDDGLQLDYSAPVVQGGIAIPLRQVVL